MALKLRVISDQYRSLGKRSSRLFGVTGGRIGRAVDNDWVLPDPDRYISSHHAKVSFRAGKWLLEDTSTNGIFVNGSDTPLSTVGIHVLEDGDRLRLGDYDLLVSIDGQNDFPADASGQIPAPVAARATTVSDDLGEDLDIASLLISDVEPPSRVTPHVPFELSNAYGVEVPVAAKAPPPAPVSLLAEEVRQKTAAAAGKNTPDWHLATRPLDPKQAAALQATKRRDPDVQRPGNGHRELDAGVEAFCRGLGIDPQSLPGDAQAAMLTLAGQMLREVVVSLMDALQSRSDARGRLKLDDTTVQPADNNPFKFTTSVDDAVRRLLEGHNTRYLGPVEAIRESFKDLKLHQASMQVAMQAAVDSLLTRIEPAELQERFDRGLNRGALLGAANKVRYWDLYTEFYQVLNQRDEGGLPTAFAEDLAKGYAEHAAEPLPGNRRRG